MNNHQFVNQDSGSVEFYTPEFIIEAARKTMGSIDFDPASCQEANKVVKATTYLTKDDNGLLKVWKGNIFMNHPFGKDNPKWIKRLVNGYKIGLIKQSCNICWVASSEKWFQPLFQFPICFLFPRTGYRQPGGKQSKGAPKGSCVTYIGDNIDEFYKNFKQYGNIMVPYN